MKKIARCHDWIPTLLLPALLVPVMGSAQTAATQAPEDIRRTAETFVVAQFPNSVGHVLHASADALDPRLRLPRCAQAPAGVMPSTTTAAAARLTVGVTCAQPKWTVYVPVRVETEMPVLVARQAVARGGALGAVDVETRKLRVPGFAATYINSVEQLAGRHLRQPLAPGAPITVDLLAADILIKRGQRVTLLASVGGIEVRAQGEAVADAGPTGRVRVLNLNSRRIVEGQVESRDLVRVSL